MAWNVYDRNDNLLDTVFYNSDCDEWYVKNTLINHDGFPSDISVEEAE